ncbi:hypothetical protein [Maribacter sp. UBA4516]|uniref:hypothetical protein n=1 Tax=Maribacter sp. UBA4516 TaxID=1946804 RepID=UPI00257D8965|nr:hypothetical protein [Maribacter sp. UBA4516]|tara:strand:+ start:78 stop:386 length:309 start_codon:yes stop_codon:yes gene_type:complete
MKQKILGFTLFIVALVFQRMQTEHFGNNLFPKTFLEFLCDLVSIIIFSIGFYIINKGSTTSNRFLLYVVTIIHLPITIFRVIIALIIKIDLWCDKVLSKASE